MLLVPDSTRIDWILDELLGTARVRRFPLPEIVLWTTASQHPSESQTSECSDLLSRSRATFVIAAQRQPGKLIVQAPALQNILVSKLHPLCSTQDLVVHNINGAASNLCESSWYRELHSFEKAFVNCYPKGFATLCKSVRQRRQASSLRASPTETAPRKKLM